MCEIYINLNRLEYKDWCQWLAKSNDRNINLNRLEYKAMVEKCHFLL